MALRLPDSWVWDCWFAFDGEYHHAFYLRASRSLGDPELRHHNTFIGHSRSKDLHTWETLPDALAPSAAPAADDWTTWTGSIVREDSGLWHMFYTGRTHADDGHVQRVVHATSDDLLTWTKTPGFVIEADDAWYEVLEDGVWTDVTWRDPWVFRGPDGRWSALLATASIQGTQDEVTFPIMHGMKWERVFYAINATAITPAQIAQGLMIAAFIRAIFTAGIYWLVLWLVGAFTSANAFLAMPAAILAGVSFGAFMLALTVKFVDSQNFLASIGRFVLTPMFMFSGTFFPLDSMPIALRWLGWLSPLWHATDLGRVLTYGRHIPMWLTLVHIAYLLLLAAVGYVLGARLLTKKMSG